MSDADGSAAGGGVPKGRTKACTACRQVKLKCNARDVYPSPCARCVAQSLDCRMDPTFKRVPARKQLEEVTNRLMKLQRSLGLGEDFAAPSPSSGGGGGGHPGGGAGGATFSQPRLLEHAPRPRKQSASVYGGSESDGASAYESRFLDLIDEPAEGQWRLDGVTLDYAAALELFRHFDRVLWRHVPFVEQCHSLHRLYHTSDLLFWTVILVAAHLYNEHDALLKRLIPAHRSLMSARIFGQRASLETIHAVLLLCTWPYPVQSQIDDITWLLCGLAINFGMVIGLHKPDHGHEYATHDTDLVIGSPYARNMTWMACFQISTSLASWLGLPPSICSPAHLETMDALCQDTRYPRAFCAKVEIQRHVTRIINGLDARLDFRTRYSLIKLYEQDLDRVQGTFAHAWSDDLEVDWLGAKVFLYGMAFIPSDAATPAPPESHDRAAGAREMLQYGLATASRLLATLSNMAVPPTAPGANRTGVPDYVYQLAFYPKHTFRVGAFASFFLMWYLAVDVHASEADKELATRHIALTYKLLYAVRHSEEHQRAAKSIEMMARFGAISSEHNVEAAYLLVNSRLGASFMYSLKYKEYDCPSPDMHRRLVEFHSSQTAAAPAAFDAATASASDPESPSMVATDATGASSVHEVDADAPKPTSSFAVPLQQRQQQRQQQPPNPLGFAAQQPQPQQQPQPATSPGVDPNNIFSNAFFQGGAPNQNFDFLWQQWDPAVFDDLRMDVDADAPLDDMSFDEAQEF